MKKQPTVEVLQLVQDGGV